MGLRIIYGKSGSGKSEYCFKEIAKLIKKEKKIYIITPEQFSFTAEKKLMNAIDAKAVINAEVITLSRMAHRVLQEIGGNINNSLTKCGKAMLIYSILNDNKGELKFLSKSDENIDICMTAITELKKHGISVEDLKNEIENCQDEYLKNKLKDMLIIYQNFDKILQNNYIEENDLLNMLAQNIGNTDFLQDSIIYIDEFSGFTYQEYEVLKQFIKIAKQVTLTVCTDSLEPSINADTDIFYTNKITVSKIMKLIKENDLKLEETIYLEKQPRFKTQELQYLEKNIFSNRIKKFNGEVQNIKLFLAKNQYSEIENVAKEITKLVRDEHFRYKDISIITQNLDIYSNLVRAIFAEYNIPVFIDEKRDLNQNIIVQYLLSIFEIFSKNFSREAVFNYLKIGFSDIENDDIFKLENYCTKWGIKQNKWKKDFTFGIKDDNKEEIEYLNQLRKKVIGPLVELRKKCGTVEQTTKAIYEFMQEQEIENKINIKINELDDKGMLDLANEYIASYKIILDILDEMVLIFGKEKISMDKYVQILRTGLKNSELGKIPGTQDQVIIGDVERSRSHKVDVIFIIGLNDGSFPSINKAEGFFGDKDREQLKNDGIELAGGTLDNLYEENFNIYKTFTTAEKKLYLSYSSSETEGKSLRPSMMIHKIKNIFPKEELVTKYFLIDKEIKNSLELKKLSIKIAGESNKNPEEVFNNLRSKLKVVQEKNIVPSANYKNDLLNEKTSLNMTKKEILETLNEVREFKDEFSNEYNDVLSTSEFYNYYSEIESLENKLSRENDKTNILSNEIDKSILDNDKKVMEIEKINLEKKKKEEMEKNKKQQQKNQQQQQQNNLNQNINPYMNNVMYNNNYHNPYDNYEYEEEKTRGGRSR